MTDRFKPRWFKRLLLLRLLDQYADALESQGKEDATNAVLNLMDAIDGTVHRSDSARHPFAICFTSGVMLTCPSLVADG